MFKCPNADCIYEHESLNSLRIHCQKRHNLPSANMVVAVLHNGVWPLCECGCGEQLKYKNFASGFGRLLRGHISKMKGHNNFHQPGSTEKAKVTYKHRISIGEIVTWNKGLLKETDERLSEYGKKCSKTILSNDKLCEQRSTAMKENRLNGTIPTLRGKDHSMWQGGTSPIGPLVNAQTRFWTEWKDPIKNKSNHTCQRCGVKSSSLEVHHDGERMADIVRHFVDQLNPAHDEMSWELKRKVVDAVIDHHISTPVSGIALCKPCHVLTHEEMGETYNI